MTNNFNKKELETSAEKYSPVISKLIFDNYRFYDIGEKIVWRFTYDDDPSIVASCNRETNVVSINLKSVIEEDLKGDMKTIEYFLLHEIRHIFQHLCIEEYKKGKETGASSDIIEKWIYENNNYVKALDSDGNENPKYFSQDSELDAYAFSYAVMKYKYGDVSVYVPPVYGKEFYDLVEGWIDYFKSNNY